MAASTDTKCGTTNQTNWPFHSGIPSCKISPAVRLLLQILEASNDSPASQINDSKPTGVYTLRLLLPQVQTHKRLLHVEVLSNQNISPCTALTACRWRRALNPPWLERLFLPALTQQNSSESHQNRTVFRATLNLGAFKIISLPRQKKKTLGIKQTNKKRSLASLFSISQPSGPYLKSTAYQNLLPTSISDN